MKCKENFAAYVKETTPLLHEECASSLHLMWDESKCATLSVVDNCYKCGIIMPTIGKPIRGDRGARRDRPAHARTPLQRPRRG